MFSFYSTARAVLLFALSCVALPALGKYDDVIFLKNGDRLSGDIKELTRDMLRYKTDAMGTLYVRWEDIQSVETEKFLRIELKSGRRVVGTLGRADAPEQLIIATRKEDERHSFDDLVAFVGELVVGADTADDEGGGRARAFDLLDQSDADAAQLDALLDQFD